MFDQLKSLWYRLAGRIKGVNRRWVWPKGNNKESKLTSPARERKNFLIVADLHSRSIKEILEGPEEKKLSEKRLREIDERLLEEHRRLLSIYKIEDYDIILARAEDFQSLKVAFPDFRGWDQTKPKPLGEDSRHAT